MLRLGLLLCFLVELAEEVDVALVVGTHSSPEDEEDVILVLSSIVLVGEVSY